MPATDVALSGIANLMTRPRTERAQWEEFDPEAFARERAKKALMKLGYSEEYAERFVADGTYNPGGSSGFRFQYGGDNNPAAGGPFSFQPPAGQTSLPGTSSFGPDVPWGDPIAPNQGGGFLSGVGNFLKENPELVTGALATGANIYGGIQQDKRSKEALDLQRKEQEDRQKARERESEEARLRMLLQALASVG